MTVEDLERLPIRVGIKVVAAALGVGINEAYRQAAEVGAVGDERGGSCPVRKRGGAWVAYRPELFRALGLEPAMARTPEASPS